MSSIHNFRVPRKEKLPQREIEICKRLESFRRDAKVPRSVFARTVGFVPERVANYETARAPIRYDAFWAVHEHFLINPRWLVTGEGSSRLLQTFNSGLFRGQIHGRELLSEVYDRVLKSHFEEPEHVMRELFFGLSGVVERLEEIKRFLNDPKRRTPTSENLLSEINARLNFYSFEFSNALEADGTFDRQSALKIYGTQRLKEPRPKPIPPTKKRSSKPSA